MEGIYRLADRNIKIVSVYPDIHDLCRDYLCDGEIDFEVSISEKDIDEEIERAIKTDEIEGLPPRRHKREYCEELAAYRMIAEKMPDYDTFLFHGSVICVDNEAYIFTAKSGTGKSTHAGLWRQLLGDRAIMVNDDKPFIRIADDEVIVYGTPYDGKHHLSNNIAVPVKAVSIVNRSLENHIEKADYKDAYPMFIQQTYRPSDPVRMAKTMDLVSKFINKVAVYHLYCNMDIEAAEIAYQTMKGTCL